MYRSSDRRVSGGVTAGSLIERFKGCTFSGFAIFSFVLSTLSNTGLLKLGVADKRFAFAILL